MKYNKAKRTLSVISSILGLLFVVGAVASVALGIVDLISETGFAVGDSLNEFGLKFNTSGDLIKWIIYIVIFILAYINTMLIIKLLKKPLLVNEKYKSVGLAKFFFSILTIIFGIVVACQFFSKEIVAGDKIKAYIVIGLAVVIALLQIISMFLKITSSKELKKAEKEVPELIEEPKEEKEEEEVLNAPEKDVAVKETAPLSVFNTIANDPIADGFEQRIREIRHLREAGLINDEQTTAAVEKIIYGFTKSTK